MTQNIPENMTPELALKMGLLTPSHKRLLRASPAGFPTELLNLLERLFQTSGKITLDFWKDPKRASALRWKINHMQRVIRARIREEQYGGKKASPREQELDRILSSIRYQVKYSGGEEGSPEQSSHLELWTVNSAPGSDVIAQALAQLESQTPRSAGQAWESPSGSQDPARSSQEEILAKHWAARPREELPYPEAEYIPPSAFPKSE